MTPTPASSRTKTPLTPLTDAVAFKTGHFHQHEYVEASFARSLETRLAEATEALKPLASLAGCAGYDDTTPDETPIVTGQSAIESYLGTKRSLISVGDVRRASQLLSRSPESKQI